jgi:acyl carrier protein
MMEKIYDKLTDIFREVFDNPDITVTPELTANDLQEWDSMSHINLIMMIELRFNIEFTQKEVMKFRNVEDMAECISSKL